MRKESDCDVSWLQCLPRATDSLDAWGVCTLEKIEPTSHGIYLCQLLEMHLPFRFLSSLQLSISSSLHN